MRKRDVPETGDSKARVLRNAYVAFPRCVVVLGGQRDVCGLCAIRNARSLQLQSDLDLAVEAAQEAIRTREGDGYRVTATVVDMAGTAQVVLRGDQSTIHTSESSFRKAFTVITLGPIFHFEASSAFFDMTKSNPFAPQLATIHNVMALPGALAFKARGEMVAALGVGGAPGGDKDEVCARAGVAKIEDRLPH